MPAYRAALAGARADSHRDEGEAAGQESCLPGRSSWCLRASGEGASESQAPASGSWQLSARGLARSLAPPPAGKRAPTPSVIWHHLLFLMQGHSHSMGQNGFEKVGGILAIKKKKLMNTVVLYKRSLSL